MILYMYYNFLILWGSVIPFPVVFCCRQVSNAAMITRHHCHHFPTFSLEHLSLSFKSNLTLHYNYCITIYVGNNEYTWLIHTKGRYDLIATERIVRSRFSKIVSLRKRGVSIYFLFVGSARH
jgi:hypothetical protein